MSSVSLPKNRRLVATAFSAFFLLCSCFNPSGGTSSLSSEAGLKSLVLTAVFSSGSNSGLSLDSSFSADDVAYETTAPYAATNVKVTAIAADSGASVAINGASGASAQLAFSADSLNVLVTVTAEDGTTKKSYAVIVSREEASANANLTALTVSEGELAPDFSATVTSYAVYVDSSTGTISLSATAASGASVSGDGTQALVSGANEFPIAVTAQNGTTAKTYTVTVYRATSASTSDSTNAYLASLVPSAGTLSPAFAYDTFEYDLVVPTTTESISLEATAADSGASVSSPATLSLTAGSTSSHTFVVTAAAGNTRSYAVSATRAAADADSSTTLSAIILHGLDLNGEDVTIPITTVGESSYSASVDYDVISAFLYSYTIPSGASVSEEGGDLAVGTNSYVVKVLAEDGTHQTSYSFAITRADPSAEAEIDSAFENATLSGSAANVSGSASTNIEMIRGRIVGPDCSVFTADVASGAWTASIDVSDTTNGPKILLVYPVDPDTGDTAGTISYIPVTISGATGGSGRTLSGTFGFASSAPSTGTVIISASPTVEGGDPDLPVAMAVVDISGLLFPHDFTLTGLVDDEYVIEAVYYAEGSDYCVIPSRYGSSEEINVAGDASLDQELVLY